MFYQITPEQFVVLIEEPWFRITIIVLAIWTLIWKGLALWRASRNYQKVWFVVLLVVNTVGLLEILYLFLFSKKEEKNLPAKPVQ